MDKKEFEKVITQKAKELNINLTSMQINQFYLYMNLLIEKNKVMNLTAIIEPQEIIVKHFIDSLTVLKEIGENKKIIDVGTGAGFPGIPIKIVYPNTEIVLLDSLNKRINFLNEVIEKLEMEGIRTIHSRAEELGRDEQHREKYDCAIARAVAPLNVLTEYLIPFVKTTGKCICMKGKECAEEIARGERAIKELGGKVKKIEEFYISKTEMKRTLIVIQKEKKTSNKYPRKAGTPSKMPL